MTYYCYHNDIPTSVWSIICLMAFFTLLALLIKISVGSGAAAFSTCAKVKHQTNLIITDGGAEYLVVALSLPAGISWDC